MIQNRTFILYSYVLKTQEFKLQNQTQVTTLYRLLGSPRIKIYFDVLKISKICMSVPSEAEPWVQGYVEVGKKKHIQ